MFAINSYAQIEGDVIDQKNKGLPNAFIIAIDSAGKIMDTVKSDERGFYEFIGLPAGKYTINAKANGFLPVVHKNIEVKPTPAGVNQKDDTYYAISLDIRLAPAKVSK